MHPFLVLTVSIVSHYFIPPFTRGFFCSDTSIRYPYKEDTIPFYAAAILSVALPIVWVIEIFSVHEDEEDIGFVSRCGPPNFRSGFILLDIRDKSFSHV